MGIQTRLKGLPIVLRPSVVREGHVDLRGAGVERERETYTNTHREREGTRGQRGTHFHLCTAASNQHTSEDTAGCVWVMN